MKPALALLPLLFLFLFVDTIESRKDRGKYWKTIMNDQKIPEGIQGLLKLKVEVQSEKNSKTHEQLVEDFKHKCEEPLVTNKQVTIGKKVFKEYFEPRPNLSAYDDDESDAKKNKENDKVGYKGEKPLIDREFEPRPSASKYND